MKNTCIMLLCFVGIYLSSCKSGGFNTAQDYVKSFLKVNLKHAESYEPLSFSQIDTVTESDTFGKGAMYSIRHTYSVLNDSNEKVNKTILFYLDKSFTVSKFNDININGNYGAIEGNIIWEYNNAGCKKLDVGSEVSLYSLNNMSNIPNYQVVLHNDECNVTIKKIIAEKYYMVVRSGNKIECPELLLKKLSINDKYIKQIFGFDIHEYDVELKKIFKMYDDYTIVVSENDFDKYGGLYAMVDKMTTMQNVLRKKAVALIQSFPEKFRKDLKLDGGYSNAYDFSLVRIKEGETITLSRNFGTTCQITK